MAQLIESSPRANAANAIEAFTQIPDDGQQMLVSAIVSVYKASKYISGCLDDLVRQTIVDRVEIIVVDSGSDEGETRIILEYQKKYKNIIYLRTAERETVYAAWNRGLSVASGKYITNANTDDRHRRDAFEVMTSALERNPDIALVYADLLITETENQTFENCTPTGRFGWLEWDRQKLLDGHCFMGPQPMWRRSLHEEYGEFNAGFITSGDYEFWLRASQTHDFMHIPVLLGLYLKTSTSIEHSNRDAQFQENSKILSEYRAAASAGAIIHRTGNHDVESCLSLAIAYLDQGKPEKAFSIARAAFLLEDPTLRNLVQLKRIIDAGVEPAKSDALFRAAIEIYPDNKALLHQYISVLLSKERTAESLAYIEKSIVRFGHEDGILRHGLTIRKAVGPLRIGTQSGRSKKISLCAVLDQTPRDLALRLEEIKTHVDEIVAIDTGASETASQIAQIFGAQLVSSSDFPEQKNPWDLAAKMASGDILIRL